MLTPFMFRKQTHVNESSETRTHTREMAAITPVRPTWSPPTAHRSTTADLEVEERAQHPDPSSQGDGSMWDQLQAFSHEAGNQVVDTASEWLSELRQEPILPLNG